MSDDSLLTMAGPADHAELLACMAAFYAEEGLAFDPARQGAALATLLADRALGRVFWIGDKLGYVAVTAAYSLEFGGAFALLDEIWLRPEARGRGLGAQALRQTCEGLAVTGHKAVRLEVERHNAHARGLYARCGFEAHDRDLMTWYSPGK